MTLGVLNTPQSYGQDEYEVTTRSSNVVSEKNIIKDAVIERVARGFTSIQPVFDESEGHMWDDDSRGAVRYACELMEEYLRTCYPIKILFVRNETNSIGKNNLIRTKTRIFSNNSSSENNGGYVNCHIYISHNEPYHYRMSTASMKRMAINFPRSNFYQDSELFNDYDGTITLSTEDIYSHRSDGEVEDKKYDLTTVVLRELGKILGMNHGSKAMPQGQLKVADAYGEITPYAYRIFTDIWDSPSLSYSYALSDPCVGWDNRLGWMAYRLNYTPTWDNSTSLQYFEEDENSLETLLYQPVLPQKTAIRRIGKALHETLDLCGWTYIDEATGNDGRGEYYGEYLGGEISTAKNGILEFGKNYSPKIVAAKTVTQGAADTLLLKRAKSRSLINTYSNSLANFDYNYYHKDGVRTSMWDGIDNLGWQFYLMTTDGKLDLVASAPETETNFIVDLSTLSDMKKYARTSDGLLRGRLNCNLYPSSPHLETSSGNMGYVHNYCKYFYIDYDLQKPKLSKKQNFLRSANSDPSVKNVNLVFEGIEGATNGQIIKKEYVGRRVYTYVEDVDLGSRAYKAETDNANKSTYQLVTYKDNLESYSEIVTYEAGESTQSAQIKIISLSTTNDNLSISFVDEDNILVDSDIVSGKMTNLSNTNIVKSVDGDDISISELPKGVYGVSVQDKDGNIYTGKFIK